MKTRTHTYTVSVACFLEWSSAFLKCRGKGGKKNWWFCSNFRRKSTFL